MKVLGVIPARGGSKGIPRKNVAPLLGKPLLEYTTQCAQAARLLTRTVLSTDDEEIADLGRRLGVEIPFLRPAELARDETPTIPVLQDLVKRLETSGDRYDAIFVLQPTNPLRRPEDIDGAIELLEQSGVDSVLSVVEVGEHHPARMKLVDDQGRVRNPPFAESYEGQPRQDLPNMFLREGSVYVCRRDVLMNENSLQGRNCRAWIVPRDRAIAVDSPWDLFLAEQMLQFQLQRQP